MNAPKFTAELKAKWIEALRSGEYKQCQGALHDGKGYCCLGVLAKVSGFQSADSEMLQTNPHSFFDSAVILKWNVQSDLAELNDDGDSFINIADHIEANIPAEE